MAVVPVFVSSTFVDFHGERDVIRSRVAPALDHLLRPLGARVELLDLRWGVDTAGVDEEAAHQRVLDVCIDEVDRCRPLFVGLVGDRFGWVPPGPRLEVAGARSSVRAAPPDVPGGLSVTALEFWHGVLAPDATTEAVVAVRELSGDVPALWRSSDGRGVAWLRAQVAAAAERAPARVQQFDYPARVEAAAGPGAQGQTTVRQEDLDGFAQRLIDELTPRVLARVAELGQAQQSGYAAAAGLLAESRSVAVGRDMLLNQVSELLSSPGSGVVLLGSSGVGKTTVAFAAAHALEASGWSVARVLVGAGPGSSSTADVVAILAGQLGVEVPKTPVAGFDSGGSADLGGEEGPVVRRLGRDELLAWWAGVLTSLPERTLLVLDGLDRLDAGDARTTVEVLRSVPSGGVRVLACTTDPGQAQALGARGLRLLEVGPLDPAQAAAAARALALADGRRALPEPVVAVLADRPRTGLWLRLAVTELSWLDRTDFARAEAVGADPAAAVAGLLLEEAEALPGMESALADRLLQRATAELVQMDLAGLLLGALALTRSGLTPSDLAVLAGQGEDPLQVVRARQLLGSQLVARDSAGRLGFDHQVVCDAALARAAAAGWTQAGLHARLAEHFGSRAGGAADGPDSRLDPTAALDRLWHALLSGGSVSVAGALRHCSSARRIPALAAVDVVVEAVAFERGRSGAALTALADLRTLDAHSVRDCLWPVLNVVEQRRDGDLLLPERRAIADGALGIARQLSRALAGQPWVLRAQCAALDNVGRIALDSADLDGAQDAYTKVRDIMRLLAHREPGDAIAKVSLVYSLARLGEVARVSGDLDGARSAISEAIGVARGLEVGSCDAKCRLELAGTLGHLCALALAVDDRASARVCSSASLGISRGLSSVDQESQEALRWSLRQYGAVELAEGHLAEASMAFSESLEISRRLAASGEGRAQPQRELAESLNWVGEAALKADDPDGARAAFSEAHAILGRLALARPSALGPQWDLISSNANVGRAAMAAGNHAGAQQAYSDMREIARFLTAADPEDARAHRALSVSYWHLAEVAESMFGVGSPAAQATWAGVVSEFDVMRGHGLIRPVDAAAESQARRKGGGGGNDQYAQARERSLADLMYGHGDPAEVGDVVRFWLATKTWDESFEVLRAGATVLVTQAALDAVQTHAEGEDRITHGTILRMLAAGSSIEQVQALVADSQSAVDLALQALATRDLRTVVTVVSLNTVLSRSPAGTALIVAGYLAAGDAQQMRLAAPGMAQRDSDRARRVAEALRKIVDGVPDGTLPAADLAAVLADLEGSA